MSKLNVNCILLVDDSPLMNRMHQFKLKAQTKLANVKIVFSGQEAIDYLNDDGVIVPEIIFIDISMPEMDGWELYEKIHERPELEKTLFFVLTGNADIDVHKKASTINGIKAVFEKPLSEESVQSVMDNYFL